MGRQQLGGFLFSKHREHLYPERGQFFPFLRCSGALPIKMRMDLAKLLKLHDVIRAEREAVLARLHEVDKQISAMGFDASMRIYGIRTKGGRIRNRKSLAETVRQVIGDESLTKQEILDRVLATGYQFTTDDPMNCLGIVIYGKKSEFTRIGQSYQLRK